MLQTRVIGSLQGNATAEAVSKIIEGLPVLAPGQGFAFLNGSQQRMNFEFSPSQRARVDRYQTS